MLISEQCWERARSQRAALNLPKMEQITSALLFNNGDAARRLQIPTSNAPKWAKQPGCYTRDRASHVGTQPRVLDPDMLQGGVLRLPGGKKPPVSFS